MRLLHWRWNCRADRERDARLAAQDEILQLRDEISRLRQELADSRRETADASRKIADFFAVKFLGRAVFDPEITGAPAPVEIPKARIQARDLVRQKTAEAERQLHEFWAAARAQQAAAQQDTDKEAEAV